MSDPLSSSSQRMVSDFEALHAPFGDSAADHAAVVTWYETHRLVLALLLPCPCEPVTLVNAQTARWAASCGLVACASVRSRLSPYT